MRIHFLGICGTFMAGLALLAKKSGFVVEGSDANCYEPMQSQLKSAGIHLFEGYDTANLHKEIDLVVIGNVIKRGNPILEKILNERIPYLSGPQWLYEHILKDKDVIAVAGTHGKTTTTSLLSYMLEVGGFDPSFLIGGVDQNFGVSARIGKSDYFIIEADEYDTAFFDKRPKFIHYRPRIAILNNLEFDHADIYADLDAIKQQFHYFIRTIPSQGTVIFNGQDENLSSVLSQGLYSNSISFVKGDFEAVLLNQDGSQFQVYYRGQSYAEISWQLIGNHNVQNALAVIAVAHTLKMPVDKIILAFKTFKNVKRRLELKDNIGGISIYDDFAHHPTAIKTTLSGLRQNVGKQKRIIAVLEFGSFTMRQGVHKTKMKEALEDADKILLKKPKEDWGIEAISCSFQQQTDLYDDVNTLIDELAPELKAGDHVLIMSNSSFDGLHQKLIEKLKIMQ